MTLIFFQHLLLFLSLFILPLFAFLLYRIEFDRIPDIVIATYIIALLAFSAGYVYIFFRMLNGGYVLMSIAGTVFGLLGDIGRVGIIATVCLFTIGFLATYFDSKFLGISQSFMKISFLHIAKQFFESSAALLLLLGVPFFSSLYLISQTGNGAIHKVILVASYIVFSILSGVTLFLGIYFLTSRLFLKKIPLFAMNKKNAGLLIILSLVMLVFLGSLLYLNKKLPNILVCPTCTTEEKNPPNYNVESSGYEVYTSSYENNNSNESNNELEKSKCLYCDTELEESESNNNSEESKCLYCDTEKVIAPDYVVYFNVIITVIFIYIILIIGLIGADFLLTTLGLFFNSEKEKDVYVVKLKEKNVIDIVILKMKVCIF